MTVDYTCPSCGAEAVTVPATPPDKGAQVLVPHLLGCPVAVQVATARDRRKAAK